MTDHAALLSSLLELLAIPNTNSDPDGLAANATWIRERFASAGADAEVFGLPGAAPVVVGRIAGRPGGPVVGVYAHYDGQPVDADAWTDPPFTPVLRTGRVDRGGEVVVTPGPEIDPEWRVYARGSSDDRAPIVSLLHALETLDGHQPETTIVFLFEGEEESGSPNLGRYVAVLGDRLAADVWLVCDGPVHQSGRPQVALGVRGFAEVEIEVFGPPADLHSGHYGEWAVNPADALSRLVASMRDETGRATIDGFGDDAIAPDAATVEAAASVPDPDGMGFRAPDGGGYAAGVLEPLVNVRGLRSADVGRASRNVVPHSAIASIDLRLVAGQDPEAAIDAVAAHVADQGFHLVDDSPTDEERMAHRKLARVHGVAGYPGLRTSPADPVVRRVVEAVRRAAGEEPVVLPSFGGSVPMFDLTRIGAPLAILPIANHDNNQHAADENLRLGNLLYGLEVMKALLGS